MWSKGVTLTQLTPITIPHAASGRQLLSAETTSLLNLLTACLLLFIVWTVLAPILDGTVSIVRNDDRHRFLAGNYGNRRFDEDNHYNYQTSGGGGYYEDATSATSANSEQYYGTNFEEHGPGVGHYSSSPEDGAGGSGLPVSQIEGYSTTGWEYAARGFEDGLTSLFNRAVNRYRARLRCRSQVARML